MSMEIAEEQKMSIDSYCKFQYLTDQIKSNGGKPALSGNIAKCHIPAD